MLSFVMMVLSIFSAAYAQNAVISAGRYHSLMIKNNGTVTACGYNVYWQLGDTTSINRSFPVLIKSGIRSASAGDRHSLFLSEDGLAWACGTNFYGNFGNGTKDDSSYPIRVMSGVKVVSAGGSHSLFLKNDGSVWSCGYNASGQLGDGSAVDRSTPVMVMSGVKAISAGRDHSLFLKTDGSVWACGANGSGRLGDGTNTNRLLPVKVMDGVQAISSGGSHSMFLKQDGSAWACGSNLYGQLGDGTTTARYSPVMVLNGVQTVSAGGDHSLFIKIDGTAWACGSNGSGRLGDGTTTLRSSPVNVMSGVLTVSAGGEHSMFLKNDGSVWSCGNNFYGGLGDGSYTSRSTPVMILSGVGSAPRPQAPVILSETTDAPVGQSFSYQLVSTRDVPASFQATGLPAGLTLDPASGLITGTVAVAGTYAVTVTAGNVSGDSTATLTLVVSSAALPFLNEPGVIRGCSGQGLNHDFGAANSPTAAGVLGLPPGLFQYDRNSDGVNDAIGGSPMATGFFRVTFWAQNAAGRTERSAIIHVTKPAVASSAQMLEGLNVRATARDAFGNTILGATFSNPVVVAGMTYTPSTSSSNSLIIKIDSTGVVLWCHHLTGDGTNIIEKLAVDSIGNIFASGELGYGGTTFANTALAGQQLFLVKLTATGTRSWVKVQGVPGNSQSSVSCNAMALDGSNKITIGGYFRGTLGFSNGTTLTSSSTQDLNNGYIACFSSAGTLVAARKISSTVNCEVMSLTADANSGAIFIAGSFSGNVAFAGSGSFPTITLNHPDASARQPFIARIAGGSLVAAYWARQIPGGDIGFRDCLAADGFGGIYMAGTFSPSSSSPTPLPANCIAIPDTGYDRSFLMKLSASTTFGLSWIKSLPGNRLPAIAFDGSNSLYFENNGYGDYFDKIGYNGNSGRYLAKLNQTGEAIWVRDSTNSDINNPPLLAVDSGGNLSLTAFGDGTFSTGDQSVSGAGTGLFQLGNPPAASAGSLPAITSTLNQTWVASRNSNREYTYQITGTNSPTSYWVSDLPVGVQFDETTGRITAWPDEPGIYTGTIWAMNAAGYGSATLTITVTPDPDPQITSPATATATVGQPFSYQITATNSPTSFGAHGFERFDTMPDGLTFNASTGLIQGSPQLAGSMDFIVHAFNASGEDIRIVRVTVAGNPAITPPTVESGTLNVTVGQALSYQIQAVGALRYGISTTVWGSGLNVNASTGLISGTPTVAGSYSITLQGINGGGVTSGLLQLNVSPANNVGIAAWRQQYFGSDQNNGNAADLATPDGDGIPNLVKYALLMTPGQNGSSRLPQASMTGTTGNRRLALTFQRDPSRNDVTIVVEAQSALSGAWTEIARSTNGADFTGSARIAETTETNGLKKVTIEDAEPNAIQRFMRLRVVR